MNIRSISKPLAIAVVTTLVFSAKSKADATWNVETAITSTVNANLAGDPATFAVQNDPIDIGYWNGNGYVPVPYFSMLMSGYSSGAEILSVADFSLNLTISPVPGTNPFNLNLYVHTGAPGNPNLATTGDVTTADWQYPHLTVNTILLQSNFLTPSSTSGTYTLNATGKANLLSYLQANYVTGNYLTFTFRMATAPVTGSDGLYRFGSNADLTGSLQTTSVPTSTYAGWAADNAGGQAANLDFDNDGMTNGVEYFMNAPAGFTANPSLDGTRTVTWPNGGNLASSAYGTGFAVQTSSNLTAWSDVASDDISLSNTASALTWRLASFANGDMGSFTSNLPSSWVSSGGTLTSAQDTGNSPFTNKFANNGSSWILDDSTDASGSAGFLQVFSNKTNYPSVAVNFDFKVTTLTGSAWGIQFDGGGASSLSASAVHYRIDASGQFAINAGPTAGVITNILTLEANRWYNVQATFTTTANNDGSNNGAGVQSGTITPAGGSPVSWSNIPLLDTSLGFSRLLVRDRAPTSAGDLVLDNVTVSPLLSKQFVRLLVTPN